MNLLLLHSLENRSFTIDARKDSRCFFHIRDHLRLAVGQTLRFGVVGAGKGLACLTQASEQTFLFSVVEYAESFKETLIDCELYIALPRPQMVKRIVESCSTFGVKALHFIHTDKVEKNYWQSPVLHQDSLDHCLLLGAEQAGSTYLPSITLHQPLTKHAASFILQNNSTLESACVLHPGKFPALSRSALADHQSLLIGPEGGFSERELHHFQSKKLPCYQIGSRILRVETAVVAALSRVCV